LKKMAQDIVGLTLLEAQELKTILKDEYGIEPAAGGAVMMAGPADGGAEEERLNLTSSSRARRFQDQRDRKKSAASLVLASKKQKTAGSRWQNQSVSKEEAEDVKGSWKQLALKSNWLNPLIMAGQGTYVPNLLLTNLADPLKMRVQLTRLNKGFHRKAFV
jgi:large subunit ribosomal protein L7/L12